MRTAARTMGGLLGLCGCLIGSEPAWGEKKDIGLSVEPGWFVIRSVPVGQLYDLDRHLGTRFKIHNGSDRPRRYRLKADRPDKVGVKVLKGYDGIPDPNWFWFEKAEVLVPANGVEDIRMFLRLPNEEKYCNQKWAVGIDVEGRPEADEGLVLGVSPVFYIETETRASVKKEPAGLLGLVPATLILDNTALGKNTTRSVIKVYNNDSRAHRYRIASMIPAAEPGRQVISPSPGFSWIPHKEWLKPSTSALQSEPHEQTAITVEADIPQKQAFRNHRWDGIIFVESEEGATGFVRVQMKTSER